MLGILKPTPNGAPDWKRVNLWRLVAWVIFSITTDGVALAGASVGQPVRVRVESGKILTGTALEGRIVEVVF